MKEHQATVFTDITGTDHLTRKACAAANLCHRLFEVAKRTGGDDTTNRMVAAVIASVAIPNSLELIAAVETYVIETAGPAALRTKDGTNPNAST